MKRYEFKAFVWTHAETAEEAEAQIEAWLDTAQFVSCGASLDDGPPEEEELDEEDEG